MTDRRVNDNRRDKANGTLGPSKYAELEKYAEKVAAEAGPLLPGQRDRLATSFAGLQSQRKSATT